MIHNVFDLLTQVGLNEFSVESTALAKYVEDGLDLEAVAKIHYRTLRGHRVQRSLAFWRNLGTKARLAIFAIV